MSKAGLKRAIVYAVVDRSHTIEVPLRLSQPLFCQVVALEIGALSRDRACCSENQV